MVKEEKNDKKESEKKDKNEDVEKEEKTRGNYSKMIEDANAAAERLEKANEVHTDNLARQEKLQVQKFLGGETEAGGAPPKSEEDKQIDSARELLKGTGFDEQLFPKEKT